MDRHPVQSLAGDRARLAFAPPTNRPEYINRLGLAHGRLPPRAQRFERAPVRLTARRSGRTVLGSKKWRLIFLCADGCFVGPFVEIQKGVVIGARTRVQSHAFICELVTIGADCFVGHGVMFINDTFSTGGPARGTAELWRET